MKPTVPFLIIAPNAPALAEEMLNDLKFTKPDTAMDCGGKSGFGASSQGMFGKKEDRRTIHEWFGQHRVTVFDYHPAGGFLSKVFLKNRPVVFFLNCIRYAVNVLCDLRTRRKTC